MLTIVGQRQYSEEELTCMKLWHENQVEIKVGSLSLYIQCTHTHSHGTQILRGDKRVFSQKAMRVFIELKLGQVAAMRAAFWTSVTVHTIDCVR